MTAVISRHTSKCKALCKALRYCWVLTAGLAIFILSRRIKRLSFTTYEGNCEHCAGAGSWSGCCRQFLWWFAGIFLELMLSRWASRFSLPAIFESLQALSERLWQLLSNFYAGWATWERWCTEVPQNVRFNRHLTLVALLCENIHILASSLVSTCAIQLWVK